MMIRSRYKKKKNKNYVQFYRYYARLFTMSPTRDFSGETCVHVLHIISCLFGRIYIRECGGIQYMYNLHDRWYCAYRSFLHMKTDGYKL